MRSLSVFTLSLAGLAGAPSVLAADPAVPASPVASALRDSPSALVRGSADSPVAWFPWGEAAWKKARAENKPLYVVVGAFTSELGRAMGTQSFGNATIAAQLNENFVCVLVDRDEHALVAASLAQYVQATKQVTGWPLNVWLTPELKPFEGATYLPPSEEWGREGITNVIKRVAAAWSTDPAEVRARAEQALVDLASGTDETPPAAVLSKEKIDAAFAARRSAADSQHGAVGEPPRALEPELWAAQLARGGADRELALVSLRSLLASPMRDPLDGGFFRASGDAAWRRPVWVKTTADQARVALALLEAADEPGFHDAARAALKLAVAELQGTEGGFITSVDALDENQAIAMTWLEPEVKAAVDEKSAASLLTALGVTAAGNISEADDATGKTRGRNHLALAPGESAKWADALKKLRTIRAAKVHWARDLNQRAGVNGLMLGALARASSTLHDAELRAAAERLATQLQKALGAPGGTLRLQGSNAPAGADDLAALAWGLAEWAKASGSSTAATSSAACWSDLAKSRVEAKAGRFLALPASLGEGWKPAPVISGIVGDVPAIEWLIGAARDQAPAEVRAVASRRCAVALEDLGGAPAAEVLAAATLLLR